MNSHAFPFDLKMPEVKSSLKEVKKVWGKEIWLVNCEEYCCKFLYLNKNALSSSHYHRKKKETFYALQGQVALTIKGKDHMLNPASRPKTIEPGAIHSFRGITDAIILEVSTRHEDGDTFRETESKENIYGS